MSLKMDWLPAVDNWAASVQAIEAQEAPGARWTALTRLANHDLNLLQTAKLDRLLRRDLAPGAWAAQAARHVKIALLGTGTLDHLAGPIRVACLRRGLSADVQVGPYNQFQTELLDPASGLQAFRPDVILFSVDAQYALRMEGGDVARTVDAFKRLWATAAASLRAVLLQQTFLPVFPELLGNNEARLPDSPGRFIAELNHALLPEGEAAGVAFLALDRHAARTGLDAWFDPVLWHHAKQEIHPNASLLYGDHVARLIAAKLGRSSKCVVLDLDNTLWGGVVGDDGLDGVKIGQGSAAGEAFLAFQAYLLALKNRGLILAVCSKNQEALALEVFDRHPDMLLRRADFSSFKANWQDKAENLKAIAAELNLGLDALLFIDDNPAERALVRRELPEVAVPELPSEPACYADQIARSGYLEAVALTDEDLQRAGMYKANSEREQLRQGATDLASYLAELDMRLEWGALDPVSRPRIFQLLQKTNQFNLTTCRYPESDLAGMMADPRWILLRGRLLDRFGDNGLITFMAVQLDGREARIDNWIMSCRVFGRQVEDAMLNLLVELARARGVTTLRARYLPTAKNGVVKELYGQLGFQRAEGAPEGTAWTLTLSTYLPRITQIKTTEAP